MRVLLIQPSKAPRTLGGEDYHLYEPLALEYLAAPLLAHHDVKILDERLDRDVQRALEQFQPDLVGVTAYTVHVNRAKALCARTKAWDPRTVTVVGGHHATVVPEDFRDRAIDFVVSGDGIASFREIIERLEQGRDCSGIAGVALERDGRWIHYDAQPLLDLDSVPFPARHLTAEYRGKYFSEWMRPLASLRTSKGCPFRCNFCAQWKLARGRYLKRSPKCIVEELARIEEPYVFFADDESLVDARRMRELARLIGEAGIEKRYFLYGRTDTIARNQDLLEIWRDVGLERVFVGFEFFRDGDLQYVGKRSTTLDNREAARILHELGMQIYASFIVRPEFTHDDFAAMIAYCRELDLNFAGFSVLTPLPGTDLYAAEHDRMLTHDYDLFDFIHTLLPTTLPIEDFYREYRQLYRNAVSWRSSMSLLSRFRLRDWPLVFRKGAQWSGSLKAVHRDYQGSKTAR